MKRTALLPDDKFDVAAVDPLRKAGHPAIAPILSDLLNWTADSNWPVAGPLADFLITVGTPLLGPLKLVLQGQDSTQKEHCLRLIIRRLPLDVLAGLEVELQRLAQLPTESDRREEVDLAARDALARLVDGHGRH